MRKIRFNKPFSKTWHFEASFVILTLFITVYLSGNDWIEYLGALAVFFTFMIIEVNDRSSEKEALKKTPDNECYHLVPVYLYLKEFLWIAYFLYKGANSAIVGSVIFILYPLWRKFYRSKIKKLEIENEKN